MEKLPPFSYDLITYLDQMFPNADPQVTDSDREIWIRKGKRELILYLKGFIKAQEDAGELPDVIHHY